MKLYYEWGTKQIFKRGEELCGDSIEISRHSDSVTMALSDGLGSGVKANILATLTTQIAMHLLENDLPLEEVVQTLTETLPVDRVRKMAYSTFAIAQFFSNGAARVVEFDTPGTILLRNRKLEKLMYDQWTIKEKKISQTVLDLQEGDWIVFVSDGVLNAGIGGVYPLGWGWDQAAQFMESKAHPHYTAEEFAEKIAEAVEDLYAGNTGDDVSIVVIKARKKLITTIFTGPPEIPDLDGETVDRFINSFGRHAVCGGTTAKIVAKNIGKPLEVDLTTMTGDVPPIGRIEGIDLVSEGILTLTRVSGLLQAGADKETVQYQTDGAANLVRLLLDSDSIHFLVGQAVNPAHQNPDLPHRLGIRLTVVKEIAQQLRDRGKEVSIESI
jgi:hypothetical protein